MCTRRGNNIQTFKHSSIQAFLQAIEHSKSPFKARCCIQDKDSTIEEEITYHIQHTTYNNIYTFACKNTNILTTRY